MSDLEIRELDIRSVDSERRIVSGIAVPYNQVANIGYYNERFAPNSVTMADNVQLFWRHQEPIGKILSSRSTDEGFEITAYISKTARGDEAYTLVRDGVINKFSVGFQSIEDEEAGDNTIVRKKVLLREVSLVPLPAYEGANVLNVRELEQEPTEEVLNELPKENEEKQVDKNTNPTTDLANEVRELNNERLENIERKLEVISSNVTTADVSVAVDNRSAGEILKAVAKQDKDTIALVERAYTGGTTADAVVLNAFVGDLTRIVDEAAVLRNVFSTGALPAEGNYIEYAQLKSNTTDIDYQENEGDDLAFGKIQQELKTAPVKTLGGYTTLSRQEIERSSVNILDASLRAQAIQAGKALNAQMRVAFKDAVDESIEDGNVVVVPAVATYADWINGIVDATIKFQDEGLSLDALVVDAATFKKLAALEAEDGRPLLLVTGAGSNNVGSINITGLGGSLASVTVVVDPKLTAGYVAFVNRAAIREYTSPVVRLQDENIINLSKDFSVYMYSAVATEIPAAIVAVVDSLEDES
jgi:HK97 family phage prohead protease